MALTGKRAEHIFEKLKSILNIFEKKKKEEGREKQIKLHKGRKSH